MYAKFPKCLIYPDIKTSLQWRHNQRDGVSNHRRLDCSLNRLLRRRSKKELKLRVTGFCEGNSLVNGFPAQRVSKARDVSIWWRHHAIFICPRRLEHSSSSKKVWNTLILHCQYHVCWWLGLKEPSHQLHWYWPISLNIPVSSPEGLYFKCSTLNASAFVCVQVASSLVKMSHCPLVFKISPTCTVALLMLDHDIRFGICF